MVQVVARPAYERVGEAVRKALDDAGLRQSDIADALGVDPATVSKWARGLQRIDLEYFPEIDRVCGQRRGYVLELAGFVDPPPSGDVRVAIAADPALDDEGKGALTVLYEVLRTRATNGTGQADAGRKPAVR